MPTGYTAELCDGEQSVADFVKHAARGMGAFYHLRDSGPDAELTLDAETSSYYHKHLKEATKDLADWVALGEEERFEMFLLEAADTSKRNQESVVRHAKIRKRLEEMRESVLDLKFDPLLESFRDFMIQQIDSTIDFDGKPYVQKVPTDFMAWQDERTHSLQRSVERAEESVAEEEERMAERKKYVKAYQEFFAQLGVTL